MKRAQVNTAQSRQGPRPYTFSFSLSGLVTLGVVASVGLCWVFILGVLVGRGYRPETVVPELARVMPSKTHQEPQEQPTGVLKPEELGYWDNLRGTPHAVTQESGKAEAAKVAKAGADQGPGQAGSQSAKPSGDSRQKEAMTREKELKLAGRTQRAFDLAPLPDASERPSPKDPKASKDLKDPKAAPARPQDKPQDKAKTPDKPQAAPTSQKLGPEVQIFEYVYQVASYTTPDQAKAFQDQLKSQGMNASVAEMKDEGKVWFKVNVLFKGRPEDTRDLKAKLAANGVPKPILRDKKPL